jgi:hypothetical protein
LDCDQFHLAKMDRSARYRHGSSFNQNNHQKIRCELGTATAMPGMALA